MKGLFEDKRTKKGGLFRKKEERTSSFLEFEFELPIRKKKETNIRLKLEEQNKEKKRKKMRKMPHSQ